MTHPMSDLFRRQVKDFSEFTTTERKLIADELDRLSAIEQEARKHYLTADGVLVLDPRTDVWFLDNDPLGSPPYLDATQLEQRDAIRFSGGLLTFYYTREAALAAAKGTP